MLQQIMKRAHELAKQMEGHYSARLSIALRQSWEEAKQAREVKLPELTGSEKQVKWATDIRRSVQRTVEKGIIEYLFKKGLDDDAEKVRKLLFKMLSEEKRAANWISDFGRFSGLSLEARFVWIVKDQIQNKEFLMIYGY